ncbi:MAG: hypothetical protein CO183_00130, partial [Candidatus Zambryskibacteria bacterium CG_4_9_14_3_um_filter_42_9]
MNKIKIISYDKRILLFWSLVAVSIFSLFIYIYAINATARNIAVRQDLEKKIVAISANLNSLEFSYIELRNNVTIELARQHGFTEAKSPLYVSRT